MDNDLYDALLFWLIIGEASWQKVTQEKGALLWLTESEFDVEFDGVDCRVEDVDSVVCFSAISLNSYGRPVSRAQLTGGPSLPESATAHARPTYWWSW